MKFDFDKKTNEFLKIITKNAQIQKMRVFFVGGMIRDKILNLPIRDIDLILEGNAIEFCKSLADEIQIISIHEPFGTVKVKYGNLQIDIASTREEKYISSGCLPQVTKIGVKIEDDVKRRDFTINSLYCEIKLIDNELSYQSIDLVCGVDDIKNKTLRILHQKSYIDDPTRILRGLDFKYRFNFDFSKFDKKLINDYLLNFDNQNMSTDRFKNVLKQVLSKPYGDKIFREIIENKIYKIVFQNDLKSEKYNLFNLDDMARAEFYFLIMENKEIEKQNFCKNKEIISYFNKLKPFEIAYYYHKTKDKNVILYEKIKDIKLNLAGDVLIKNNYKQGRLIGTILDNLLEEKIINPMAFKSEKDELAWVFRNYPNK